MVEGKDQSWFLERCGTPIKIGRAVKGRYLSKREWSQNEHIVKRDGEEGEIMWWETLLGLCLEGLGKGKRVPECCLDFWVGIWNWHWCHSPGYRTQEEKWVRGGVRVEMMNSVWHTGSSEDPGQKQPWWEQVWDAGRVLGWTWNCQQVGEERVGAQPGSR